MIKIWLCHDGVCDKGWSCALQWLLEKHFSSWLSNLSQAPLAPSANNRLCAGFFWTPHPLTHTLTLIILRTRNHAQYRWNCLCETILLVERTYITDMHTLQCSGRTSKQLTEANESGLFIHQQNMYWRPVMRCLLDWWCQLITWQWTLMTLCIV